MDALDIGGCKIGPDEPTFIIAEVGVNHNGNPDLAHRLVDAVAGTGADAVKFQTFKPERIISPCAPKAKYQEVAGKSGESQLDMVRQFELSHEVFRDIHAHCREAGVRFLSTPFDEPSADFLVELGVSALKIPSGEITNLPFLSYLAEKGLPMFVSTGMASLGEVEWAVETMERAGNDQIALLHCVSNYPANPADVNLRAMLTMAAAFGCTVGFSDHTVGRQVPIAAVAIGGRVLEKHITLSRDMPGPDQRMSTEPDEFARLVDDIRSVESALGDGRKLPAAAEAETAIVARKSLVAICPISSGTTIRPEMITAMRPGNGLPPSMTDMVVGKSAVVDLQPGEMIKLSAVA